MKTNSLVVTIILAVLTATVISSYTPSESYVTINQPKQEHHVIYISMCGVVEGIILTTDPIQYADWQTPMTREMLELELEAYQAGRVFSFVAGLWVVCPEQGTPKLEVIQ